MTIASKVLSFVQIKSENKRFFIKKSYMERNCTAINSYITCFQIKLSQIILEIPRMVAPSQSVKRRAQRKSLEMCSHKKAILSKHWSIKFDEKCYNFWMYCGYTAISKHAYCLLESREVQLTVNPSPICRRCGATRLIRSTVKKCQRPLNTIETSEYKCPHKEKNLLLFCGVS